MTWMARALRLVEVTCRTTVGNFSQYGDVLVPARRKKKLESLGGELSYRASPHEPRAGS